MILERNTISRRDFMKLSLGTSVCLGSIVPGIGRMAFGKVNYNTRPKNILIIMTDQQHFETIAAGGCKYVSTPAMDKLYRKSLSFSASYSTNPVCGPARSSIFTGRASSETGVYRSGKPIISNIPNIGQWFGENTDYEPVYSGKWALPKTYTHFIPGFKVIGTGIPGAGYVCDPVISRACESYIRTRSREKSFMMVASLMQPHDICEWFRLNTVCPEELDYPELANDLPPLPGNFQYDKREPKHLIDQRKRGDPFNSRWDIEGHWDEKQWRYYLWSYYRHIEMLDAEIGRILDAIEETGRTEDTLIILTSDHGEGLAEHQTVRKSTLYEEAVRVQLLFSWPGHIKENMVNSKDPVSGYDILPTLCDYAGIEAPPNMRGVSLKGLIEGGKLDRDFVISEVSNNLGRMVRSRKYKYVEYLDDPVVQLFDMHNDPRETKNLAQDNNYERVLREHRAILLKWEQQLEPSPNLPHAKRWVKT